MSLHNLLELDTLSDKRSSAWKPKAKPRIQARSSRPHPPPENEEEPRPKPRRRVERDVDEVVSMSSISSGGDHISQSAYHNPLFLSDDGNVEKVKQHHKGTPPTKERESRRSRKERRYSDSSSSSPWEGEESYLYIENEGDEERGKKRSESLNKLVDPPASPKSPKKIKGEEEEEAKGHVSIEIEQEKMTKVGKGKPKIGNIWKRFLSRSASNPSQPLPHPPEDSVKGEEEEEEKKTTPKMKRETSIKIQSESESEEETVVKRTPKKQESKDKPRISEKIKTVREEMKHSLKEKAKKKLEKVKSPKKKKIQSEDESDDDEEEQDQEKIHHDKRLSKEKSSSASMFTIKSPKKSKKKVNKEELYFGVTIHSSDLLPIDPNVLHPVVKVTLMTKDGHLLRKSGPRRRKEKGRREGTILPIMTQPFKFQMNFANPILSPIWNELLLWEEPFQDLLDNNPDLLLFFEITDFLPMNKVNVMSDGIHGSDVGWHKLAWAFLKTTGANGVLNVDKKLRLQLFKPFKLRNKEILEGLPEVFCWWKSGRREKLFNTTLYVTVKGVSPSTTSSFPISKLLSMRKNELTDVVVENQLEKEGWNSKRTQKKKKEVDLRKMVSWGRLEGQSCKVPNKFLMALPSSPIESLNLTISGNVHSLKFSPCGLKLAAGLDTDDLHAILIFEIPSGHLLRSLKNHHGLIYDLAWAQVDISSNVYMQFLASASADSTACVWSMRNNDHTSLNLIKTLHHPSFVYAAKFHPTNHSLLLTACFDFIIRAWKIDKGEEDSNNRNDSSPLFLLDQHCSFVNCLAFDPSGSHLFSGDANSWVYKWSIKSPTKKKAWVLERERKLSENGKVPINSLSIHPSGVRLLCHLRDNCLKILDTVSFTPLHTIRGLVNDRLQIKSCFSPCGNLILSGSEDSTLCIWDADTYAIADFISPKNHPSCFLTCVDYHPHDFIVAVGLASVISEPNPILLYTYDSPKFSRVAMVQAGVTKFKSNLRTRHSSAEARKAVTFSAKSGRRGDSSEKFMSIIDKLDAALKDTNETRRERHRSETLQRSVSVQAEDKSPPKKPSRSGSVDASKTKSPRTFIEDRLEELILPTVEKEVEQSKQYPSGGAEKIPKHKKRPHSSKIPTRRKESTSQRMPHSAPSSPQRQ